MVNDINIHYKVQGSGFPLVMIMGLSGNLFWWGSQLIEKVSKHFKVIIFDNRGAGLTDKPRINYSIRTFAEDTIGLMDALNIESTHIQGMSMGGMIAQEIALNYPERVEKLVLCSTNCGKPKSIIASQDVFDIFSTFKRGMNPAEAYDKFIPILFSEDFIKENPDIIEEFKQLYLKAPIPGFAFTRQISAIMRFKACRRLKEIKNPTLVMHGKKDILVPPQNGEILANLIPGAKLVFFENSAHAIFSQEPDLVINTLLEFLK